MAPKPKAGETWQLKDDFGTGPGHMTAGTDVTVSGIHPPGTPGLGFSETDIVTAEFTDAANATRVVALPVPDFVARFKRVS
jgi:hypothetical protein